MADRVQSISFAVIKEIEMTLHGQVRNGLVVLDKSGALPDGTEVTIRPVLNKAKPGKRPKKSVKTKRKIMRFAGKAKGLPADAARNLDHYLYGHPKR
jgi:hypothetical protein